MQKECQVCSQPGHGNHFGVNTCRACAAFFRRSVVQRRKYSCRKGSGTCKVNGSDKFVCRHCRYRKCIALGMTPENVQWNRDVLSTTVEREGVPEKRETKSANGSGGTTHLVQFIDEKMNDQLGFFDIMQAGADVQLTFDVSRVVDRLREIFSQEYQHSHERNLLVQMYRALERHRSNKNPRVEFLETIDLLQKFSSWKTQLFEIAKWMMSCEDFAALPLEDKELIFKGSWILWQRFERVQMSVHLFGEQAIHERMVLMGENTAVNINTVRLELGPLTDYDPQKIRSMFEDCIARITEDVTRPLLELDLDPYEVSYILNALVWHVEGRNVKLSTRIRAEAVLDRISDELHNHYTYDLRMPNYAARLTRIMGVICSIEKDQYERAKLMELARVFKVFKFEMSEEGIFHY